MRAQRVCAVRPGPYPWKCRRGANFRQTHITEKGGILKTSGITPMTVINLLNVKICSVGARSFDRRQWGNANINLRSLGRQWHHTKRVKRPTIKSEQISRYIPLESGSGFRERTLRTSDRGWPEKLPVRVNREYRRTLAGAGKMLKGLWRVT